ncbi:MFS transporter, PPP family, 3-phenylpropionic acid transporter [Pseudomonas delhiensis]|uniref:MFS transporter, PPP family, 3-phenylpropionic acid transporter n=1 Tax=Pseudomonas delhiensis TaxID=366289 RepID=A0A239NDX0_9PSED|nr:MFS transporter [Pseudomonas delhiensis]SDK64286.1 MFS transporter, PPP family, 3-phenylpropionic acid transporter [Pseudomonas delhiensis]SNT52339.1 MFS transporter, PPP family, 3-phenylpropionic acid transporter [Pseudomonas delhiensis]
MAAPLPYWRLSSFYFFYFCLLGGTAPFLALYFHHLGFSAARIGELVAIPMLMRCVAPNLWGWLGDRSGQRLRIVRFGALCTAACFALIFLDHSYAWLALVMAGHAFFWHAVLPQFEVITLAHLGERTASYSRIRLWGSIGFICTVVGLGRLFEATSLDYYPWALLAIMLGIVGASWWVPNAQPAWRHGDAPASGFLAQLRQPGVIAFYLCVCLMQLSHGPYYTFLTLHLERLGYSRGLIGWLWALGVVAEVLLFLAMPRLLGRFSLRQVLAASFLLAALRWLLLGSLAGHLGLLLFAQLLHAATFGAFHAAAIHFVQRSFQARQQGQGQALYAALAGTGGALGALYSGYSWASLGPAWTFAIASLAALAAAVIIGTRLKEERA